MMKVSFGVIALAFVLPVASYAAGCGGGGGGEPTLGQLYNEKARKAAIIHEVQLENQRIWADYQDDISDMIAIAELADFWAGTVTTELAKSTKIPLAGSLAKISYSVPKALTFVVMGENQMAVDTMIGLGLSLSLSQLGSMGEKASKAMKSYKSFDIHFNATQQLLK